MTVYNPLSNQETQDIMRLLLSMLLLLPLMAGAQQAENTTPPPAQAGPGTESSATTAIDNAAQSAAGPEYTLVDLLGGKDQMLEIQAQLVDTVMIASPDLRDYQPTVAAWAQEYLQWNQIRERLAAMYRNAFSVEELDAIVEFYRSPAGLKLVLLMPTLLRESSQIGLDIAAAHRPELIDMLRAAREEAAAQSPETVDDPAGGATVDQ